MTTLYMMSPPLVSSPDGSARGRSRVPGGTLVPPADELVAYSCEMDEWAGEALIDAIGPWFLATPGFCEAVASAGLTGLYIGNVADAVYSPNGRVLASLGELFTKELPEFRIVAGRHPIDVRPLDGRDDGVGSDDDLRYTGWAGEDFSSSRWGPVVTEQARRVIEAQYPPVLPRQRHPSWTCFFQPVSPR
jgi:hypothetical protein